jgi:hypothetical protein
MSSSPSHSATGDAPITRATFDDVMVPNYALAGVGSDG